MGFYGESFRSGWPTLLVVLLTTGLIAIQIPVVEFITASGKLWIGLAMVLCRCLLFIVATLLLTDFGSLGLAIARAVSYAFYIILTFGFVFWIIRKNNLVEKSIKAEGTTITDVGF